ncbi:sialidase family protein [Niabella terrae]
MKHAKLILAFIVIVPAILLMVAYRPPQHKDLRPSILWQKGTGKYNNYRIPSLITTKQGTLLAFCEAREKGDTGDIDLLVKRSEDNGRTWSDELVVWDDGSNTCGNPCPVVDQQTGRIWLMMTWNNGNDGEKAIIRKQSSAPRIPYICYSDDDGLNWSRPQSLKDVARDTSWGWYATGPGIGIQIQNGIYKGRLVIPANHSYDDPSARIGKGPYGYGAHVLYSDDHGKTWLRSASITPGCNESQVTELSDGSLLMNMRSYNQHHSRAISYSKDGGITWSPVVHDLQLVESVCQASILNLGSKGKSTRHLFFNPAVPEGRTHLTLKLSLDDCKSWSNSKLVYAGPGGYSSLSRLKDGQIGLFFEAGRKSPYEKMVFVTIPESALYQPGVLLGENDF